MINILMWAAVALVGLWCLGFLTAVAAVHTMARWPEAATDDIHTDARTVLSLAARWPAALLTLHRARRTG